MITEIGPNAKCLDTTLLDMGMEDIKFCKVCKVTQKLTIEGKPYLRMVIKDVNGVPIIGRMFEGVMEFLSQWPEWNDSIVLAHFSTSYYMGQMSLDIISVNKPDVEMRALINEDSFCSTYPYLEEVINNLTSIKADDDTLTAEYNKLLQSSTFNSLLYYSDETIMHDQNGGIIALISLVADSLKSYCSTGVITTNDMVSMLIALIIVKSNTCLEKKGSPVLNTTKVTVGVYKRASTCDSKYVNKITAIAMSYCNILFGIKDNVSPLACVLDNLYNEKLKSSELLNTIKYCTKKSGDCIELDGIKYYRD